jgi:hypothetical protein
MLQHNTTASELYRIVLYIQKSADSEDRLSKENTKNEFQREEDMSSIQEMHRFL